MDKAQQIFAIIAVLQGEAELKLSENLTFEQCSNKIEFYMQAADHLKDTDVLIICESTGGYFVSF